MAALVVVAGVDHRHPLLALAQTPARRKAATNPCLDVGVSDDLSCQIPLFTVMLG